MPFYLGALRMLNIAILQRDTVKTLYLVQIERGTRW